MNNNQQNIEQLKKEVRASDDLFHIEEFIESKNYYELTFNSDINHETLTLKFTKDYFISIINIFINLSKEKYLCFYDTDSNKVLILGNNEGLTELDVFSKYDSHIYYVNEGFVSERDFLGEIEKLFMEII